MKAVRTRGLGCCVPRSPPGDVGDAGVSRRAPPLPRPRGNLVSARGLAKARLQGRSEGRPGRAGATRCGPCGPGRPRGISCGLLFSRELGGNVFTESALLGGRVTSLKAQGLPQLRGKMSLPWVARGAVPYRLPGGLVARIRRFHRRGPGSIPGQGITFYAEICLSVPQVRCGVRPAPRGLFNSHAGTWGWGWWTAGPSSGRTGLAGPQVRRPQK